MELNIFDELNETKKNAKYFDRENKIDKDLIKINTKNDRLQNPNSNG